MHKSIICVSVLYILYNYCFRENMGLNDDEIENIWLNSDFWVWKKNAKISKNVLRFLFIYQP